MRSALAALLVAAASLGGCAPSVPNLVRDKHYREAVCAGYDRPRHRDDVADALLADAGLYLHVHRVTADELRPVLGDATDDVLSRVQFVRVRAQTNALPLDRYDLQIAIESRHSQLGAAPVEWPVLAHATGETLPNRQTGETYVTIGNMARAGAAVMTGGLSLFFTRFRPARVQFDAPLEEYARMAPLATALHQQMSSVQCTLSRVDQQRAASCAGFYALDAGPEVEWSLKITETFVSEPDRADEARCAYARTTDVALGHTTELATVFGAKMRARDELSTRVVDDSWQRTDP